MVYFADCWLGFVVLIMFVCYDFGFAFVCAWGDLVCTCLWGGVWLGVLVLRLLCD